MKMKNPFLQCISCSKNNGDTQISIKSTCLKKNINIVIDSEDEKFQIIQSILNLLIEKQEDRKENLNPVEI